MALQWDRDADPASNSMPKTRTLTFNRNTVTFIVFIIIYYLQPVIYCIDRLTSFIYVLFLNITKLNRF
jgi:hypothetical protein